MFTIQSTKSGIDKIKLVPGEGETPYITRTDANNGIDSFITEQSTKYRIDEGNVITIGLDTQTVFYQSKPFYTGQNIQVIKHPKLDKFNALFLIVAIKQLVKKFSWGSYGATLTRLRKSRIYLPTNQDGEIDFEFMSTFMQNVEQDILKTTLPIFKAKLNGCKSTVSGGVRWTNYLITSIFPELIAGKSKGLNHLIQNENGIQYLGATNLNNGVLAFVEPVQNMIQRGNCIAFIRNGEGSMGYSVYVPSDFIATSDISIGYHERLNKYTGTFITTIADRIRGKYNFGFKRSAARLKKEVLTLPSCDDGSPDWEYMENYMRELESRTIAQYLQSKIAN